MLEEISFCDAHFHFSQALEEEAFVEDNRITGCVSCHSKEDFDAVPEGFIKSFGIHPQNPEIALLDVLEKLVSEDKLHAIGETGFDFFTEEFKSKEDLQKKVFEAQLDIALSKGLPLVIHSRKANDRVFYYSKELRKLPGVLFHSFMGSLVEAESFQNRGINAFFSFGKQIFNNNKKVIQIVQGISLGSLLLETDAPYQFLKNEKKTFTSEIKKVYEGAYNLRQAKSYKENFEDFTKEIKKNFCDFYRV